jgi:hypothetical protein
MKKLLFQAILFSTVLVTVLTSCEPQQATTPAEEKIKETTSNEFFKQSVAFTDAAVRYLNAESYVKEIHLKNFSTLQKMPSTLTFAGTSFFDDGSYNDEKAKDGIYTSAAKFSYNKTIVYHSEFVRLSVLERPIVDKAFKYKNSFRHYSNSHKITEDLPVEKTDGGLSFVNPIDELPAKEAVDGGHIAILECDIEFGTCGCKADNWSWCNCCCFSVSNCSDKIGWE